MQPKAENAVASPADMIAFTEIVAWRMTSSDNSSWVIDYPRPVRDRQFDLQNSGNSRFGDAMYAHRTGLNQVFGDGHVEFRKRQDFESDSDRNRRRWLADNQPHRELRTRKPGLPP